MSLSAQASTFRVTIKAPLFWPAISEWLAQADVHYTGKRQIKEVFR